jgi:hypothetical protein
MLSEADLHLASSALDGEQWIDLSMLINEHRGRRAAAKVFDLLFISPEKLVDVGSGSRRLICCVIARERELLARAC